LGNRAAEVGLFLLLPVSQSEFGAFENWNNTLSNGLQLAPQKGVYADDLDIELERLYTEHVAPPRKVNRVGAPSSRHRFVHHTLREAGIEPIGTDHFATWVPKLKPTLQ
jgi:hypothetical protein